MRLRWLDEKLFLEKIRKSVYFKCKIIRGSSALCLGEQLRPGRNLRKKTTLDSISGPSGHSSFFTSPPGHNEGYTPLPESDKAPCPWPSQVSHFSPVSWGRTVLSGLQDVVTQVRDLRRRSQGRCAVHVVRRARAAPSGLALFREKDRPFRRQPETDAPYRS